MHRALFVHEQPDILKSFIFMPQAKKVVRHVDKRAPGKIQEYMVELGRTRCSQQHLSSNHLLYSPIVFLPNTQKSENCLCMQADDNPWVCLVLSTVRTKYYHEDFTSSPLQPHGSHMVTTD